MISLSEAKEIALKNALPLLSIPRWRQVRLDGCVLDAVNACYKVTVSDVSPSGKMRAAIMVQIHLDDGSLMGYEMLDRGSRKVGRPFTQVVAFIAALAGGFIVGTPTINEIYAYYNQPFPLPPGFRPLPFPFIAAIIGIPETTAYIAALILTWFVYSNPRMAGTGLIVFSILMFPAGIAGAFAGFVHVISLPSAIAGAVSLVLFLCGVDCLFPKTIEYIEE